MVKIGTGFSVGFSEEAVWGTAETAVDHFIPAPEESIKTDRVAIEGEGDLSYRGTLSDFVSPGTVESGGGLGGDAQFGGGWLMFLAHLNGLDVATTGVGPYAHALQMGAPLGTDITGKGITVFTDREGQKAAGTAKAGVYPGFRPTALEIAFERDKRARLSIEGVSKKSSLITRPTLALPTEPWILSPSPLAAPSDFFTWGGTPYNVMSATLRFAQAVDTRRRVEDDEIIGVLPAGDLEVTLTVEVEAPDTGAASGGIWHDDYDTKAIRAIVLTAEGDPAATYALTATLDKAMITTPGEPDVAGPGVIRQTVEFKCFYSSSDTRLAQVVLNSNEAAAWT